MATVGSHIRNADQVICKNIELYAGQRALLAQNLLAQLRNLVEAVIVRICHSSDKEFRYEDVGPALSLVKKQGHLNFLSQFHKLLQQSSSHFTWDEDASERLMLKYYEYLYRIRAFLWEAYEVQVLENLESFPIDLDPSLREYHQKIAARLTTIRRLPKRHPTRDRYYIHSTRPFFVGARVFYEVTFYIAINNVNKYERIIAFTDIEMSDKYAALLTLQRDSIEVLGETMPIAVITDWEVSIRPCEFNNFARIVALDVDVTTKMPEYRLLMETLTSSRGNLLDLIDLDDDDYTQIKAKCTNGIARPQIFPILDSVRDKVKVKAPGQNILRYLMLRMRNQIIKSQFDPRSCHLLSDMKLSYGCIPFDTMPFCTSLTGHNPRYWDLVESLDATDRKHELLARHVKNRVDRHGNLYTSLEELSMFGDISSLKLTHNDKLYYKHTGRRLMTDKGHVFIKEYEDQTVAIVEKLQQYASVRIDGYTQAVGRWLDETVIKIDDPAKKSALKQLFSESRVALIYGAAGTGKSTMVDYVARYFNDKSKLFLAHTNPAMDNLKRKVSAQNSEFRTISSHIRRKSYATEYDLLVIDECSTVSNADLIRVLENTDFKLLILVGDVYQIESIRFGNWFEIIKSFIPTSSVFELTTPYRTTSHALLDFWSKVREIKVDLTEFMVRNNYSSILNPTLFEPQEEDEIILCLNYDGLYGINNINRFLQSSNPSPAVTWGVSTYKVGDPILFHDTERFRPVIYNNLKGWIVEIGKEEGWIQFAVKLDRPISQFDTIDSELEWIEDSIVRFVVYKPGTTDVDDDALNTNIPFQVAYAVSIHKAQGLEYDSVKVVITDANEDEITHSIFYTAVTRARGRLQIFWTPETQHRLLQRLQLRNNVKDTGLLISRRGLMPI